MVNGYDGKQAALITHAIVFTLIVDGRRQRNVPFLIVDLGKHDVILGRMWFAKHGVLLDCAKRQLRWLEDISLQDKIVNKNYDANRRDRAFEAQEKRIPVEYSRSYQESHDASLLRMEKALRESAKDLKEEKAPPPQIRRNPEARKLVKLDIAMLGGNGFHRLVQQKKSNIFFTSLHEVDKIIDGKSKTEEELELEEIREKLPFLYLKDFADVFSKRESDKLLPHQLYDHKIELEKPNELSYHPLYKMSLEELEAAREYILDNLSKGFIEPSNAPFASPIIMAEKPGGGLRFCVDYRKLNQLTKKDRYPLPLIDEVFERLNRARIFTKLDIRQGFHRIRMDPESEDLTTFRCRYGTYKYKVMPFGLTNGPATFQRLVNDLFMDCLDQFLIAFIDDLLIYSENELEHEIHVKRVLEGLRSAGLQAALHKCEFHVTRTKFLGFILTPEGIEVD
jgi:hypothetical protein